MYELRQLFIFGNENQIVLWFFHKVNIVRDTRQFVFCFNTLHILDKKVKIKHVYKPLISFTSQKYSSLSDFLVVLDLKLT